MMHGGKKMASVQFENVTKRFGDVTAVNSISLKIADGEFVSFVGPSGCGKTTSLRMVAGLEQITEGRLYIGDKLANYIPAKDRGIAMVFQSYALFPHMTIEANIGFGLKIKKVPEAERREKIDWALKLLHLEGLGKRYPRELSGGQRQRVALGRALVLEPDVLLLDEPLSNLDAKLRLRMRTELKRIHKTVKSSIIYVTHDQVEAMTLSDRVAIMNEGQLMQVGSPLEVYSQPENMFVAGFIGSPPINFFDARLEKRNDKLYVATEDFALQLTEEREAKARSIDRPRVILGIRPQDIHEKAHAPRLSWKENEIRAVVDVMEPLGDEVVATVIAGKQVFQVTLTPETEAQSDKPIDLLVDLGKMHIFDPETEKAVLI
jgi:multiple sugar transport system ATP-binding protein